MPGRRRKRRKGEGGMRGEKARNITGTRPEVIGNKRCRESGAGEDVSDSFIAPIAMRTIRRWSSSNAVLIRLEISAVTRTEAGEGSTVDSR